MKILKMENSNKNQDLLVILIETDDEMFLSHTAKGLVFQLKLFKFTMCILFSGIHIRKWSWIHIEKS